MKEKMIVTIEPYLDKLTKLVYDKINDFFKEKEGKEKELIEKHFIDRIDDSDNKKQFANFQKYYFETLDDKKNFYSTNFFGKFIHQYRIQGIDGGTITQLDSNKENKEKILKLIESDQLSDLYFNHFANVEINRKDGIKEKNLGSFFTKIVHTFKPDDYTPLDIPLRKYFKLEDESYFVSFIVVSNAYKQWANNNGNKARMERLREEFKKADKNNLIQYDKVTDMKLLNLIFWSVADYEIKKRKDIL
jgi:hypothetical protein